VPAEHSRQAARHPARRHPPVAGQRGHRHRLEKAQFPPSPVAAQEYERAASLRDREKELLAQKALRQQQWAATHPDLPSLAEKIRQLSDEIERLHALLREHGIEPEDGAA
jgi:hypothetical protein